MPPLRLLARTSDAPGIVGLPVLRHLGEPLRAHGDVEKLARSGAAALSWARPPQRHRARSRDAHLGGELAAVIGEAHPVDTLATVEPSAGKSAQTTSATCPADTVDRNARE